MKSFKSLIAASAVLGLMASPAMAGTLQEAGIALTTWKVAKEVVEGTPAPGAASTNIGAEADNWQYTPTDIALGSANNALVIYTAGAGNMTVAAGLVACAGGGDDNDCIQVCEDTDSNGPDTGDLLVAWYKTGSGTNTLQFQTGASLSVANSKKHVLAKGSASNTPCDTPLVATDLVLTVPAGTTATTMTVKTGSATTQAVFDQTSATTIVEVKDEFVATVTTKADAKIDPAAGFKKFTGAATSDTIVVTSTQTALDHATTPEAGDITTITVTLSDVSGLAATSVAADNGYACTLNTTTKKATCTKTAAAAATAVTMTFTVNGTSNLAERTFTVTEEINFLNAVPGEGVLDDKDRTAANSYEVLKDADAGSWTYFGTTLYIPLVKVNAAGGEDTYIKLQSSDLTTGANGVNAVILASDGSTVTANMGTITAGTPLTISGTDLMAKVTAAGKTVSGTAGFAAKLTVYTSEANLYSYANTCSTALGCKRIPTKTSAGTIVE